jgi:hypothetical protein
VSTIFEPEATTYKDNDQSSTDEHSGSAGNCGSNSLLTPAAPGAKQDEGDSYGAFNSSDYVAQKPYDPFTQFYSAIPNTPKVIPPEPMFSSETAYGSSFAPEEEAAAPVAPNRAQIYVRAVTALAVIALAITFCLANPGDSRAIVSSSLDNVRSHFRSMYSGGDKPLPLPKYTATPVSRRTAVAAAPVVRKDILEMEAVRPSPVPKASGPGTMRVGISTAPRAPNVIPISIEDPNSVAPPIRAAR